ncbi:MAG: hypothetical protein P1S46_04600 [bacterium]|nr:hypothetical protein [bacterium]MDT8396677.1 hypothetical protein [bacterium]
MLKNRLLLAITVIVLLLPTLVLGQGKTASLVGYEKAELVQGTVSISEDGISVVLSGVTSTYDKTLEFYLAKGFDLGGAVKVGELSSDMPGDMTFEVPDPASEALDSVLVMVPGWDVPVAVGLLR